MRPEEAGCCTLGPWLFDGVTMCAQRTVASGSVQLLMACALVGCALYGTEDVLHAAQQCLAALCVNPQGWMFFKVSLWIYCTE